MPEIHFPTVFHLVQYTSEGRGRQAPPLRGLSEGRQDLDRAGLQAVPGAVRVQEAAEPLLGGLAAVLRGVVAVRRRHRVEDVVGRATVGAACRIGELADGELQFVRGTGRDVVRILDPVDVLEDRESLGRRDVLLVPDRHTLRQLADLVLDLGPGLHGILVLGLEGSHVPQAEAVRLLHDPHRTVGAGEAEAVERAEERTGTLEVVNLEEVVPLLADHLALVFEHPAVDLEGQHFVRAVREHVAPLRRDPALRDQRSDGADHVAGVGRRVPSADGLRRDHGQVGRADEVELPLDLVVERRGVRPDGPLHRGLLRDGVVHAAVFEELVGRRGHASFPVCGRFGPIADLHYHTPIRRSVKRKDGFLFQALRLDKGWK